MEKRNGYQVKWCTKVLGIFLLILVPLSIEAFGRSSRASTAKGMSSIGRGARGADFGSMGFDKNRAPRPDALSYQGSTPQIVSPFNAACCEELKLAICDLKQLVIAGGCCSKIEGFATQIEHLIMLAEENLLCCNVNTAQGATTINKLNYVTSIVDLTESLLIEIDQTDQMILSKVCKIDTQVDAIIAALGSLSNIDIFVSELDILVSTIEKLDVGIINSLIVTIEGLNSVIESVSSKIDVDIALDETILSKVCKIDTQLDTVESLV
jgi:hypothetical protein